MFTSFVLKYVLNKNNWPTGVNGVDKSCLRDEADQSRELRVSSEQLDRGGGQTRTQNREQQVEDLWVFENKSLFKFEKVMCLLWIHLFVLVQEKWCFY